MCSEWKPLSISPSDFKKGGGTLVGREDDNQTTDYEPGTSVIIWLIAVLVLWVVALLLFTLL
jgi:hypothetical protein